MQVGTPPQIVSVLVSTAGNQPWVTIPLACNQTDPLVPSDCVKSRGGAFQTNASSTWYVFWACFPSKRICIFSSISHFGVYIRDMSHCNCASHLNLISEMWLCSTLGFAYKIMTDGCRVQNNFTTQGIFALGLEQNLGFTGNGLYGYDTISLSYLGSGLPALNHQVVAGIAAEDFWLGQFGVNPAASNFSSFNHPIQSYSKDNPFPLDLPALYFFSAFNMHASTTCFQNTISRDVFSENTNLFGHLVGALKSQNMIPSLSYGYTAGNQYRFNKVLGSLTLGGYDAAIFEPNDLTIPMSTAAVTDLTVNIQSVNFSSLNGTQNLSVTSFSALVDSTVAQLYLPDDVCDKFEEAFSLTYDNASGLYLVNDTLHSQLLSEAANVTFTLTNVTTQVMVDIVLPYQAFDLMANYPLVQTPTRYFPLQRSQNSTQNTLGRTFLQEA